MALVIRDGAILMVNQNVGDREFFILPGGGIEENETPGEAALRELQEECGLQGVLVRPLTANYKADGSTEYVFQVAVSPEQESIVGKDPETAAEEQIIVDVKWMRLQELSEKDRAFLWYHGLLDVDGFEATVIGWGDAISYPAE